MPIFGQRLRYPAAPLSVALFIAALFRLYAVVQFGPILQPDSADYLDYARNILSGSDWIHTNSVEGVTSFRAIGYPAVIAGAKLVAGSSFELFIVALQSAFSLIAMTYLDRVGRGLGLPGWVSACAALAYGCGAVAVFDLNILTDSLFANLTVIVICLLALAIIERAPTTVTTVIGIGALFTICILVREATLYSIPFFALGAAAWGYGDKQSLKSAIRTAAMFVLPALVVWQGYLAWNQYRSGQRFMTTAGQHGLLMKPVALEQQGIPVLRDPRLRQAYAVTEPLADGEFFTRVREMGVYLRREAKLDAVSRVRLAEQAYFTAWREALPAMLREVAKGYRANQFLLLVNFNFALRELKGLAGVEENVGYRVYFQNLVSNPSGAMLAPLTLELIGLAISGTVFIGFVCGGIHRFWCVVWLGDAAPTSLVPAWFLILYAGFVGMYAMVHLELRYTICMQAIALISGVATIHAILVPIGVHAK